MSVGLVSSTVQKLHKLKPEVMLENVVKNGKLQIGTVISQTEWGWSGPPGCGILTLMDYLLFKFCYKTKTVWRHSTNIRMVNLPHCNEILAYWLTWVLSILLSLLLSNGNESTITVYDEKKKVCCWCSQWYTIGTLQPEMTQNATVIFWKKKIARK